MPRKHLYLSLLLLLFMPQAMAQTNLYEEIMLQTDSAQLYYTNSRRLLAQRLALGLFEELLEIVDFAEPRINNDTTRHMHIHLVERPTMLALCLLNGDYARFFSTMKKLPPHAFHREWLGNMAEQYIITSAQRWLQWLDTYPMTNEQRTAASAYLYSIGIDPNIDKAQRLCAKAQRELKGTEYAELARYAVNATTTLSFNIAIGVQPMLFRGHTADFVGTSTQWPGYAELSLNVRRLLIGCSASVLSCNYSGSPLSITNKYGTFEVKTGERLNLSHIVFCGGYRLTLPRRITCYAMGELGLGSIHASNIKIDKNQTLEVLPSHLVLGANLRAEIDLLHWRPNNPPPSGRTGFKMLLTAGARTTPPHGAVMAGTAALAWYF